MKKLLLLVGLLCTLTLSFAQAPANDECNTSQTLQRQLGTTCTLSFSANTTNATASAQTSIYPADKDDDIWFDITLGTGQTEAKIGINNINITGTNNGIVFELWSSDCSTRLSYSYSTSGYPNGSNATWSLTGLTSATTYKVRAYTNNTISRATFGICFLAGPSNDDCDNPTVLVPVSGNNTCTFTPGIPDGSTLQATPSSQSAGDGTGKDDDVWFQFTTTSGNNAYKANISNINWVPAGSGQVVIELWSDCGNTTYINWYPFATTASFGTLTPNTTYKVRIYTYGTSYRISSFNICISYTIANDASSNATPISLSNNATCTNIIAGGTTLGSTPDNLTTCTGTPTAATANDVWYSFTASTLTAIIKITNKNLVAGTSTAMWMQVYDGNTSTSKLCVPNTTTDSLIFDASTASKTLTPGNTYLLRIYNNDPASTCTFDICSYMPNKPSYDDCNLAVNLLVSTDEYCNNKVRLSNDGATTSSVGTPSCVSNVYNDVWLRFTAPNPLPATGLKLSIQNFQLINGSNPNLRYAVYSGNCSSLTYLSCDALPTLVAGTTYYIRIFSASGAGTGSFDVCLSPYPATLTNTTCANAVTLTATTDQSASFTQGSTYGLAQVSTVTDCFGYAGTPNKVLWYKFVATATSHFIDFQDMIQLSSNANSLGFRVTSGSCPTTTALSSPVCIFGVSNQNQIVSGLTIGSTYFIEVMENTFNGGPVSYKMRVIGTSVPTNDEAIGNTLLIQNPTCSETNGSFKFSTLSAAPPASLGATYYQDVWYKFQAVATTATINISGRLATPRIAIYNAAGTSLMDAGAEAYSYTVSGLTVGTFYTIRVLNTSNTSGVNPQADFKICLSGVPSSTLAVGPTPLTCLTNDNSVVSSASNIWLHFTRGGNLIASVLDGANMGVMTAKYYINTSAVRSNAGVEYLDRNMEITPTTQPSIPVKVRLYFTKAEFDAFVAANDGDGNDAYWLNDLKIAKFSSLNCSDAISGTGEALYGIAAYGNLSSTVYFIDVIVPSFSGFFIKNVASSVVVPLVCNNFNYKLNGNNVLLNWNVITNGSHNYFKVERSFDGINFTTLSTVDKNITNQYQYNDVLPYNTSKIYYRLIQVNKDGKEEIICRTLNVNNKINEILISHIYPNPANNFVVADILKPYAGKITIEIFNTVGKKVKQQPFEISLNDYQLKINIANLPKGTYWLKFVTSNGIITQKITKM